MNTLIVGDEPFVSELAALCAGAAACSTDAFVSSGGGGPRVDAFVECVTTGRELKRLVLQRAPEAGLVLGCALNASATAIAAWSPQPERVVGFGALPPIPARGVIELAGALQTGAGALVDAEAFWRGLGQEVRRVADGPGLVRARIVCCLANEAISAVAEGVAAPQDIDTAMRLGTHYPLGPLAWADRIGLDTLLAVMTALQDETGEERYRPSPLLRRMVAAGRLGHKTGHGFYDHTTHDHA